MRPVHPASVQNHQRMRQSRGPLGWRRSADGSVWGTYLHGVFDAPAFRRRILNDLRLRRGWAPLPAGSAHSRERHSILWRTLIREHLDLAMLEQILNGSL